MTKAIFLLVLLLATVGCTEYITQEQYMERQNTKYVKRIEKFQYEGHNYIALKGTGYQTDPKGIEHDPNCHCFASKSVEKDPWK